MRFFILIMTVLVHINLYNTGTAKLNVIIERRNLMEDAQIILEKHEQWLRNLERDVSEFKTVQEEIRTMNETLVTLATELHLGQKSGSFLFPYLLLFLNEFCFYRQGIKQI